MNWLKAAGLGVFAAAVVTVLSVPLWPTPTYVSKSGVHVGEGGAVSVFVHGCGVEYDRVMVRSGGDIAATYAAAPVSGAQVFEVGAPAPDGWRLTRGESLVTGEPVQVTVSLVDASREVRFRDSDVGWEWLDDPGFVVLGTYDSAVAHLLARPGEWDEVC
ncbi:hypothetical protein B841_06060 [Corynebacterium maris DSM 45190]|uniref:Uncharacterized protein n=1 Tax=Corynebacterium maris DSM 45190 TaxID=1224163 RepID=S5T262_9CORY|nr:hypothetical protein [Corynebacterium maris]AGS34685.1 hypothetical protein B841_06060 [Corynebacterium maris DSM 45190]